MKNKYLFCTGILTLLLCLTGCGSVAKLAVESDEVVTIDATAKINPSDYLKDVAEDAEVSYSISDGVMTITATKGDKTETFEVPVEINEPSVSIDEGITIDTYVGYDLEEYIHEDEGVSHTTNFNEETGELSVIFTKGEWTTTLDSQVEVTSSDPIYIWPKTYSCYEALNNINDTVVFYENGRFTNSNVSGTFTYTENGPTSYQEDGYMYHTAFGDFDQFSVDFGKSMNGTQLYFVCTLVK